MVKNLYTATVKKLVIVNDFPNVEIDSLKVAAT